MFFELSVNISVCAVYGVFILKFMPTVGHLPVIKIFKKTSLNNIIIITIIIIIIFHIIQANFSVNNITVINQRPEYYLFIKICSFYR